MEKKLHSALGVNADLTLLSAERNRPLHAGWNIVDYNE